MIFKNKKGDLILDIITIFIMLIVYFNIYPALDAITLDLLSLDPDSISAWFIRGTTFFILVGILKYVLSIRASGGEE